MSPSIDSRENREFAAELKFVVTRPLAESIRAWARTRLAPDPNAGGVASDGYQITSLYFDTKRFDVFHQRGSYGRSKFRVRRYGANPVVFLERKLKTHGLVAKRRSPVRLDELARLDEAEPLRAWAGRWYHQRLRLRALTPICQISYCRTARVAMTANGPIRLTIDENVRALPATGLYFNLRDDGVLLREDPIIVELKFRFETPILFKELVERFRLNAQSISKYRKAVATLGFVPDVAAAVAHPIARASCQNS